MDFTTGLAGTDWTKITSQPNPIKIVDGQLNWCGESLAEFLSDQNEYR